MQRLRLRKFVDADGCKKRSVEAARIREKYPDRIPASAQYLVPADLTVGQFVYVIRKIIKLSAEKAIFIFVDNVLPPTGSTDKLLLTTSTLITLAGALMSAVYEEKKDDDGFLYVTYSGENTCGSP
ncbi:hypothetical protein YC2023_002249 [Brassica napus]